MSTSARPDRALLLDLDGTLADSLACLKGIYLAFLREHGRTGTDAEFAELNGPTISEVVGTLATRYGLAAGDELERRYHRRIAEAYPREATLRAGARELLDFARGAGFAIALVTSASEPVARGFLDAHGLSTLFDEVVTGDLVRRSKPDPEIYRLALARLGVEPSEAVAVEDSPNGVRSATGAGIPTLFLGDAPACPEECRDRALAVESLGAVADHLRARRARPRFEPLGSTVHAVETSGELVLDPMIRARVDELWRNETRQRGTLYDGGLVSYVGRLGESIAIRRSTYRFFLASLRDPAVARAIGLRPLAASGLLLAGDRVALGRRPAGTTQYPGWYELVPSGGITPERILADGSIDVRGQLLDELEEEVGIERGAVLSVEPFGLIHADEGVVDIAVELRVEPSVANDRRRGSADDRYEEVRWIALRDLDTFLAEHRGRVVPACLALLGARGLSAPFEPTL